MTHAKKKMPRIKRDRGFIMSSAWYTQVGNNYRNWTISASNLFAASMILTRERKKERKRVIEADSYVGPVSVAINTDDAELLLTAFGIEALLKAVYLNKGKELVKDGKYVGLPCENNKSHNLVAICKDVDVFLSSSERHILQILSDVGRYKGRYPIARAWTHMEPIFYWDEKWDEDIGQLITRLWIILGFPMGEVPIGGAPLPQD